ncbi:hypothetical protein D3C80_1574630 [compost metagenome]
MRDRVDAGDGNIHADADAGETHLVAIGYIAVEGRFDRRAVAEVDTAGGIGDGGIRGEPEGFIRPVGGEDHRLGGVELTRCGVEGAHVAGGGCGTWGARADRLALAKVQGPAMGILIPRRITSGAEVTVGRGWSYGIECCLRRTSTD